jgi:hypothetical protein
LLPPFDQHMPTMTSVDNLRALDGQKIGRIVAPKPSWRRPMPPTGYGTGGPAVCRLNVG